MHESDLQTEHPPSRLGVDQLGALPCELPERGADVLHLVGDMVHPRPAPGEEPPHRRVVAERCEELDAAPADAKRGRFDTLLLDAGTLLEATAEAALVRRHRLVEIGDRDADVMDPPRLHVRDRTRKPQRRDRSVEARG